MTKNTKNQIRFYVTMGHLMEIQEISTMEWNRQ